MSNPTQVLKIRMNFSITVGPPAAATYVLRGLFAALGYKTRYVNLYNIPNQGNHTLVEVQWKGGTWSVATIQHSELSLPRTIARNRYQLANSDLTKMSRPLTMLHLP